MTLGDAEQAAINGLIAPLEKAMELNKRICIQIYEFRDDPECQDQLNSMV
jgi:hypothetical protein